MENVTGAEHAISRNTRLFTTGDLTAGGKAGLIAGAAMGTIAMIIGAMIGGTSDMWTPLQHVAAVVYGETSPEVASTGFRIGPAVIGTGIHFLVSAIFGVVFAVLYRRVLQLPFQLGLPFLMGGVYGFFLWGAAKLALPVFNPLMASEDKPAFLLAHIVYGVALGLMYQQLHPRLPRRTPE